MIVVCDTNEIWRRKPFVALAEKTEVLGVSPADWLVARRRGKVSSREGAMEILPVSLPLGWASRTAGFGQRLLWKKIATQAKNIDALFLTSPHYLPMLDLVDENIKTIYYASDDYRSYEGWGLVADLEKEMVRRVDHAFFVSEGLMRRAQREYGVEASKLSVSMNATEARFFPTDQNTPIVPLMGNLKRPVAGVVGGINDRLDFGLLRQCADLPDIGTLLLVGPLPSELPAELKRLLGHAKCAAVGRQPHETIHRWFQCLDVGLIPYVETELNRYCSPMRLFDHLASGVPLVATDACEQVKAFEGRVSVCSEPEAFVAAVRARLGESAEPAEGILWSDRATEMLNVVERLNHA